MNDLSLSVPPLKLYLSGASDCGELNCFRVIVSNPVINESGSKSTIAVWFWCWYKIMMAVDMVEYDDDDQCIVYRLTKS